MTGADLDAAGRRTASLDMISFGTVFLELVFGHVPELPRPGEEVYTEEFAVSCGGAIAASGPKPKMNAISPPCGTPGAPRRFRMSGRKAKRYT